MESLIQSPNTITYRLIITTFFQEPLLPPKGDALTTISWDKFMGASCCSNIGIEISKCMVIVVVLVVYSISDPKYMFTSLMPRHVNLGFFPLKNNIARAHFLVKVKKIAINQVQTNS
jgi:hypothetical protein